MYYVITLFIKYYKIRSRIQIGDYNNKLYIVKVLVITMKHTMKYH